MSRRIIAVVFACVTVLPILRGFGSPALLSTVQDDFYYYAKVADHLAREGRPSFDGVTLTNGFHPLWMAVLVLLARLAHGIGPGFFALLAVTEASSSLLCSWLLWRLSKQLFGEAPLAGWLVAQTAASELLATGMECVVQLPIHLFVLLSIARAPSLEIDNRQALRFGALASLLVLARLDAALLIVLLVAGWLVLSPRQKLQRLLVFAAGGSALALYLACNLWTTGHLMPVSAQSKQLVRSLGLSAWPLLVFFYSLWLLPWLLLVAPLSRRPLAGAAQRLTAAGALLFPPLAMAAQAIFSPWVVWPWHSYWLPPFLVATAPHRRWLWVPALAVCVAGPLWHLYTVDRSFRSPTWIQAHALPLAEFARSHPGRYAMGDRAGLTAYLLGQPLVQLEGLIADQKMVEHIRHEDDLVTVLREYGVDYFIVTVYQPLARIDGCYSVEVPDRRQSGERALRMHGRLCDEPLLHLATADPQSTLFPRADSYVFFVRQSR